MHMKFDLVTTFDATIYCFAAFFCITVISCFLVIMDVVIYNVGILCNAYFVLKTRRNRWE